MFDPALEPFLASVPIVTDPSADTAKAYPAKGYIGVSPDWDNTVRQSKYRAIYEQRGMKPEDPVFIHRFKTDLLIHEFLHILQAHQRIERSFVLRGGCALVCRPAVWQTLSKRHGPCRYGERRKTPKHWRSTG